VVGRLPGTEHYRNTLRHSVTTWPELLLVRIDENLYFANAPQVESRVLSLIAEQPEVKHLVLILSGVAAIDASGLELLESLLSSLQEAGVQLHLAEIKGPVMDHLQGTHFLKSLGSEHTYLSTEQAVAKLTRSVD